MDTASSIEFFAFIRHGRDTLLVMRAGGYFNDKGTDIQQSIIVQKEDGTFEFRLKPFVEGKPCGQWIVLGDRGKNSMFRWYENNRKLKDGCKLGLDVDRAVVTLPNVGPNIDHKKDDKKESKEDVIGEPISYDRIKTWFDKLVKPQDFVGCQDVQNRYPYNVEEKCAVRLNRKRGKTRCYKGKVGHIEQNFHIHDVNCGEILIEFDLKDFSTLDFDVSRTKYEIKLSKDQRKSITFPVTHTWIDLNKFQIEFCNKDVVVCRQKFTLPWWMPKLVFNQIVKRATSAISSILGKDSASSKKKKRTASEAELSSKKDEKKRKK